MSGLYAQIGVAEETTYGDATGITIDRFYPLVSESLTQDIARMESAGIIAGARVLRSEQWAPGRRTVAGDVGLEWYQQNMALWWSHMLGSITSSFSGGIGTHTATPGDLTGKSLMVQVGKPTVGGQVVPFTYSGVKVQSWEISVATGGIATVGLTLVAQSETLSVTLAAASYDTDGARPFHYVQGAVSISASDVCVRSLTVGGANNLATDRECIGQDVIDEPVETALREFTGQATLEFSSTQQYQRYLDGDEFPISLAFDASPASAALAMNARFDPTPTPTVGGRELLVPNVPFKCIAPTADADAITAVIVNSQSSP